MNVRSRRLALLATAIGLVGMVALYWGTFKSMQAKWSSDAAFGYGIIIAPIALWLVWKRRGWLTLVPFSQHWLGVAALVALTLLWVVAKGTGVLVVEQLAVISMVSALVLTTLGWRAVRALMFPLGYLYFMVPFGRALVPLLVESTADIATWALQVSGIPVLRSHVYISIPDGNFEVAKACSGTNVLMAMLVLSILYSNLNYSEWRKRVLFVIAAAVVAIVGNGIRVYVTIAISHLTSMQYGPGAEHIRFAQYFQIASMLILGWIGLRWRDRDQFVPSWLPSSSQSSIATAGDFRWTVVGVGLLVLFLGPYYQMSYAERVKLGGQSAAMSVRLPNVSGKWTGPLQGTEGWRPRYGQGLAELRGRYVGPDGGHVDAFVAVYGLGSVAGTEMISYDNVLYVEEHSSVPVARTVDLPLDGGAVLRVMEVRVPDGRKGLLVWHWYVVGGRTSTSQFVVKALEALSWITRGAQTERVITLATPYDDLARGRLDSFLEANRDCVSSGFDAEACGG